MQQVHDDLELLDLMIADYQSADPDFQATARWAEYSERFLNFLKEEGLRDFRSRRHEAGSPGAVLASFGALDINPAFERASPTELFHSASTCFLGRNGKTIRDLPASTVGNPEGFEVEGRFYTLSWLNFYCRYAYVTKFMNLDDQTIVEVGPGSGKQAELLKRAHPNLTIVLFDLPTQLYVANQYLTKVFEGTGDVVDYRACRDISSFDGIVRGKINILPHWKYPIVNNREFDLLWNAASFQEMGPETAKSYLNGAASAKHLFLMYNIKYRENAPLPGARGMIDPKYLTTHLERDRIVAKLALQPPIWLYFDSFWDRAMP
jgi:putative sugar O-methyltransferase